MIALRRGLRLLAVALAIVLAPTVGRCSVTLQVSLDTTGLLGGSPGQYAIDFLLINGNGTAGDSTITLSDFQFGSGGPLGSPTLFNGASGDLGSTVTLQDSSFVNEFTQNFDPGGVLSFIVTLSSSTGVTPDSFSFAILDNNTGLPIPTLDPLGTDNLLSVDLNAPTTLTIGSYGTDPQRTDIVIDPPKVETAPEPSTLLASGIGLAMAVGWLRLRRARRAA